MYESGTVVGKAQKNDSPYKSGTVVGKANISSGTKGLLEEAANFVANGGNLFLKYDNNSDNTYDTVDVDRAKKQEQNNNTKIEQYKGAVLAALSIYGKDDEYANALKSLDTTLDEIRDYNSQYARAVEELAKLTANVGNEGNTNYDKYRKNADYQEVVATHGSIDVSGEKKTWAQIKEQNDKELKNKMRGNEAVAAESLYGDNTYYKKTKANDLTNHMLSSHPVYDYSTVMERLSVPAVFGDAYNFSIKNGQPIEMYEDIKYMTKDELALYIYVEHTDGEKAARDYLTELSSTLSERKKAEYYKEVASDYSDANAWEKIGLNALSVVANFGSAFEFVGNTTNWLIGDGKVQKSQMAEYASAIRAAVSNEVDWEIGDWDVFDTVYNTGMSMLESWIASALPAWAAGLWLGSSAGASATNDALDRGMSDDKAILTGIAAFVFEGFFEWFSIGKFKKMKDVDINSAKDYMANVFKSVVVNASEEGATEFANIMYDTIVNGEYSNWHLQVEQYKKEHQDATDSEAKKYVLGQMALQVAEAAGSGALMGLGFGNIANITSINSSRNFASKLKKSGNVSSLTNLAKTFSKDTNSYKLSLQITENSSVSEIGKLFRTVSSELSSQNKSDIALELRNRGVDGKTADRAANWFNDSASGEKLKSSQKNAIKSNEMLNKAFGEIVLGRSSVTQRILNYIDIIESVNGGLKTSANDISDSERNLNAALSAVTGQKTPLQQSENGDIIENKVKHSPDEHKAAILRYKSGEAYIINAMLRENEQLDDAEQEFVDTLDEALKQLPTYEGTVYRNVTFDDFGGEEAFDSFIKQHAKDKLIIYNQFISCSTVQAGYPVEGDYKIQLIIQSHNARNVDGFGNNMESEVIFPLESAFIVDDIKLDGEYPIITLQEAIIDGYQSVEEQGDAVRNVQELYSEDNNMQGVPAGNTEGDISGSIRPQPSSSGRQGDTVRTGGRSGTVLPAQSAEQEIKTTEATSNNEAAFSMPENGAEGDYSAEGDTNPTQTSQEPQGGNLEIEEEHYENWEDAYLDSIESMVTEPDISKEKISWIDGMADEIVGHQRKTEGQMSLFKVAKKLGWKIGFADLYKRDKNGKVILDEDGEPQKANSKVNKAKKEIIFDYDCGSPFRELLKHELTHFLETNVTAYQDFANAVMNSRTFQIWVLHVKKFNSVEAYNKAIREAYDGTQGFEKVAENESVEEQEKRAEYSANLEMVADFVSEMLFEKGHRFLNRLASELSSERHKVTGVRDAVSTVWEAFKNLVDIAIRKLKSAFANVSKKSSWEIIKLEEEWIKTYKKAEAAWQEQQKAGENIDKSNSNDVQYKLINNQFPPFNQSQSDANEWAARWALSDEAEVGDQKLASYHNRWYLIEKFNDVEFGYRIMERLTKKEYESYKGVIGDVRDWNGPSIVSAADEIDSSVRRRNGNPRVDRTVDNLFDEHTRTNTGVLQLGTRESQANRIGSGDLGLSRTGSQRNSTQPGNTSNTVNKEADLKESAFSMPKNSQNNQTSTEQKTTADDSDGWQYSLNIKRFDGTVEKLADARNLTNVQAINYLQKAKSGALKWNTYIPVRKDTPQVVIDTLKNAGESVKNLSLIMQVRKAQQAMSEKNKGGKSGKHGNNVRNHALSPEEIVEIINNLDNPTTIILQTNRYNQYGEELPNNIAVFVEYSKNEGVAVIEFESSIDPEFIGTEFGDTDYHTVVTLFEPDTERDGMPFDYAEELLSNPDNYELEIVRRQSAGSAIGKKRPNTSSKLPSNDIIDGETPNVNTNSMQNDEQYSLSIKNDARNRSNSNDSGEYSYQNLIKKKDMPITFVDDSVRYVANRETRETIINDAINNAKFLGRSNSNGNATVYVSDIGSEVILSKAGLRHGLDRRLSVNAPVTLKVGEILRNSIRINELNPKKQNVDNSYVLIGIAKNTKNEPYVVQFVVNKITNEVTSVDVLYSVNAKTEPVATNEKNRPGAYPQSSQIGSATLTDSSISIANLLELVNKYFPDVLPEDVYKYFGYTDRPQGALGESVKYSLPIKMSPNELLDLYDSGEIDRDELLAGIKSPPNSRLIDIANTSEDDVGLPALKRKQGKSDGNSESNTYESLLESDIFDQKFKDEVKTDTFIEKYKSVTNKETLKTAAEELDAGGKKYVNLWWALDSQHASLIDIAVGFILMDRYQRIGDYESSVAAAEKVREMGTAAGQQVQIFSILGRLDPNTMAIYAQKELSKAYKEMVLNKSQSWINKNKERFKLTEEEIEFIRRHVLQAAQLPEGSRDKAIRLAEINTMLQDKLPPERGQGIKALQRISMLLNPKTNVRNILGNAGMVPVFVASDVFGSGIDRLASKKSGVRTTGMFDVKSVEGFKKGAFESYDDFKRHINTRNEELNRFDVGSGKSFNEHGKGFLGTGILENQFNDLAKVLNGLDRMTSFLLEVGDRPFYEMWFMNSLNNQMKLNKVNEPTVEMIQIATTEALQRTWQDVNKVTEAFKKSKDALNTIGIGGYGLGDIMIKFTKTPANLTKAVFDFSPAGVVKAIVSDGIKFKNSVETGNFDPKLQKNFVDSLSKGITGTMIYVAVFSLASVGWIKISGAGDEDKDLRDYEKNIQGIPEYSIKIGNKWYSYDWAQPFGAVIATVADYMESSEENPDSGLLQNLWSAVKVGGETLYNQSFMKSIQNLFTADSFVDGIMDAILDEPSTFVPQFLSQTASLTDDYRRITYEYDEPFRTALNRVMYKIPGLRQKLEKQVDVLGREVPNSQSNVFDAYFNPGNTYTDTSNEVSDEVYGVYKRTGDKKVIPRKAPNYIEKGETKYTYSAKEVAQYQKVMGQTSSKIIEKALKSDNYKKLSDSQKAMFINSVYDYAATNAKSSIVYSYEFLREVGGDAITEKWYEKATDKAKKAIAEEHYLKDFKRARELQKDDEKIAEYFIAKTVINSEFADENGNKYVDKGEKYRALENFNFDTEITRAVY